MLHFVVGETLFFSIVFYAMYLGGNFRIFLDIPSLLLVVLGTLGLTMASHGPQAFSQADQCVFGREASAEIVKDAAYFWLTVIRNLLAVGTIGSFIGLIHVLQNAMNPADLGPSMAVAYLAALYGIMLSVFFPLPAYFILKRRLMNRNQALESTGGESS